MKTFKVGDYVYFNDNQMAGEIVRDNNDGTYDVEWYEGINSGTMTVDSNYMELGEKPDWRYIPEMNIQEYDEKTKVALDVMRNKFKSMTMGDIQTILMFCTIFKEMYLVDPRMEL